MQEVSAQPEQECSFHPGVTTALACSRCMRPICAACGQRTEVGLRCPACVGARRLRDGSYFVPALLSQASPRHYAQAGVAALLVGVLGGMMWGQWRLFNGGDWSFWFIALIVIVGGEAIAQAANDRRNSALQLIAAGALLIAAASALVWHAIIINDLPLGSLLRYLSDTGWRARSGITLNNGLYLLLGLVVIMRRLRL